MAWWRTHRKPLPGQQFTARDARKLAETADWSSRIKVAAPLSIVAGAAGPLLRYAGPIFGVYIVVTTSTVTARSGGTAGSGTAKVQTWDGASFADLGGPVALTIFNWNSATGGIASGKYAVVLRISGSYFAIAAEC